MHSICDTLLITSDEIPRDLLRDRKIIRFRVIIRFGLTPVIACLTLGGMNGTTQRELSFLMLLWGLSDPRIAELRKMPRSFSIKLHSETQVSGRLGISGGRSLRHAQNPSAGERRKALSMNHHALSPPQSHHHLYIIHLIN